MFCFCFIWEFKVHGLQVDDLGDITGTNSLRFGKIRVFLEVSLASARQFSFTGGTGTSAGASD